MSTILDSRISRRRETPNSNHFKVLCLEDIASHRLILTEVFQERFPEFEVEFCWQRDDVLGRLAGEPFDLVITDLELGWTSGFAVLDTIRANWPECLTIVVSVDESMDSVDKAIEKGAIDYVSKAHGIPGLLKSLSFCVTRLQALKHARRVEGRLQRLLHRVKLGVFRMTSEGALIDANPTMLKLIGLDSKTEAAGFNLLERVGLAAVRSPGDLQRLGVQEVQVDRDDGSKLWLSLTFSVEYGEDGGFILEGLAEDVTARKLGEIRLRASNDRLKEALEQLNATQQQVIRKERMSALGQMASGIAHDINNSLAQISGFSELLEEMPKFCADDDKARTYTTIIRKAAGDAAATISKLRKFYKPASGRHRLSLIDLNTVIEEVVDLTRPVWKDQAGARVGDIEVRLDLQARAPLLADASRLRQALTNLVLNAFDAMPEGGFLKVRSEHDDDSIRVEITDTGVGMSTEVLERCFDPFFTTKGDRGTGLGMGMVADTMRDHNGQINVRSEPGRGTTIRLQFETEELSAQLAWDQIGRADDQAAAAHRPCRVLHLDDEDQFRLFISQGLGAVPGFEVVSAATAEEALDRLELEPFDVIITDRSMPGMGGDCFARIAKENHPEVPIMMLTGFGEFMTWVNEAPESVDRILSKPIDLKRLRAAVLDMAPPRDPHSS